jgi:frataxin-like iron-binding protein CyaY
MTGDISMRDFEESARRALMAVEEAFDELDDDGIDTDLVENVLTIRFDDGSQFLLNMNGPAREIWLSANRAWVPRGDRFSPPPPTARRCWSACRGSSARRSAVPFLSVECDGAALVRRVQCVHCCSALQCPFA